VIAFAEPETKLVPSYAGRIQKLTDTISASRLGAWQQCRLKFWFRYVEELPKPKAPALLLGSAIHSVLQEWNLWRWEEKATDLNRLEELFRSLWAEAVEEGGDPEVANLGWSMLDTYIRQSAIPFDEKPEAVEVKIESDLTKHGLPNLVGVLDLVRPGGRIVDFKTTSRTPDPRTAAHMYQVQTTCYALLYRENTGEPEGEIELHHLVKTKKPSVVVVPVKPVEQVQIDRLFRLIDSYAEGLQREDIIPSPGFQCASCEFFAECQRWS